MGWLGGKCLSPLVEPFVCAAPPFGGPRRSDPSLVTAQQEQQHDCSLWDCFTQSWGRGVGAVAGPEARLCLEVDAKHPRHNIAPARCICICMHSLEKLFTAAQLQTHRAYLIHSFLISCGLPHFLALIFGNPPCLLGDHSVISTHYQAL